ncbi:MAG: hypothetical protein AUG51_18805 [Acidobacteria bacterium 13_1_20CM_3_53_8]|nr:MAG: hypothetical protein AUG51_18805 [Acidobacteria bacterium 13_1_20CM_3_53_8]
MSLREQTTDVYALGGYLSSRASAVRLSQTLTAFQSYTPDYALRASSGATFWPPASAGSFGRLRQSYCCVTSVYNSLLSRYQNLASLALIRCALLQFHVVNLTEVGRGAAQNAREPTKVSNF